MEVCTQIAPSIEAPRWLSLDLTGHGICRHSPLWMLQGVMRQCCREHALISSRLITQSRATKHEANGHKPHKGTQIVHRSVILANIRYTCHVLNPQVHLSPRRCRSAVCASD